MHKFFTSLRAILACSLLLAGIAAFAQSLPSAPTLHRRLPQFDISAGIAAQLTSTRAPFDTNPLPFMLQVQNFTPSVQEQLGLHQQFRKFAGYKINLSNTKTEERFSQEYWGPLRTGVVHTSMREVSINWTANGPRTRNVTSFAEIGGGGLFFKPASKSTVDGYSVRSQIRPALTFGYELDRTLTPHWLLRAAYRGILYKGPTYELDNAGPATRLFTVTSLPSIGLVYRISPKR